MKHKDWISKMTEDVHTQNGRCGKCRKPLKKMTRAELNVELAKYKTMDNRNDYSKSSDIVIICVLCHAKQMKKEGYERD